VLPIPYLKEAMAGLLFLLFLLLGVQTVRLSVTSANLRAAEAEAVSYAEQLDRVGQQVLTLREQIDSQNDSIDAARERGLESQAAMDKVAEYSRRLARAERELEALLGEHRALRERAEQLNTCETYELVLQSIAGVLP
jgi:septal ring factor EnvC (AmiA/AmiB activator)